MPVSFSKQLLVWSERSPDMRTNTRKVACCLEDGRPVHRKRDCNLVRAKVRNPRYRLEHDQNQKEANGLKNEFSTQYRVYEQHRN